MVQVRHDGAARPPVTGGPRARAARGRRGGARLITVLLTALALLLPASVAPASAAGTASISGTVRDGDGLPLSPGVRVYLYPPGGAAPVDVVAGPDGGYTFAGLEAGDYVLRFYGGASDHVTLFYDQSRTRAGAQVVTLAEGEARTGLLTFLTRSAHVDGRVTGADGAPVGGVDVFAYSVSSTFFARAATADDGTYDLGSLHADTYRIWFHPQDGTHASQYFLGASDPDDATLVTVAIGERRSGVDVALEPGGSIAGTVTDASGAPQPGVVVRADAFDGATAITEADGSYLLQGLDADDYVVTFTAAWQPFPEMYDDALHPADVTLVPVAGAVTGVDAVLQGAEALPDVAGDHPFALPVSWLVRTGVATGYDDGTFRPTAPVTRQAMAAFLYRAAGSPPFSPPATSPFVDVDPGHPFFAEIAWLAGSGITTGTATPSGTVFLPGDAVSRQAMAAFLHRAAGSPPVGAPAEPPFADVSAANPFHEAVLWLAQEEIATGTAQPDGTSLFLPTSPVSRQAMAAFLYRAHGLDVR